MMMGGHNHERDEVEERGRDSDKTGNSSEMI